MVVSSGYLVTTYNACVERTIYMDYTSSRKQINLIEIHFTQLNLETPTPVAARDHSHKVSGSTGSRNGVEGRHFIKLWYEGGIHLWNDKLLCGTRP